MILIDLLNRIISRIRMIRKIITLIFFFILSTCNDKYYFEPYVTFNDHIQDINKQFVIFPPGRGGAESFFNNIVPLLKERRLILFNHILLHISEFNLQSILKNMTREKLAFFYINLLKSIQPSGPYNFFGYCFGGTLAIEISRILKEKFNDEVSNIFLVDSFVSITNKPFSTSEWSEFNFWEYESKFINIDSKIYLFKALKLLNEYFYSILNTTANNLDKIIRINQIKIYLMDEDHESWISNHMQLEIITNKILEITNIPQN